MSDRAFIVLLSFISGLFSGFGAVIIKNTVRFTKGVVDHLVTTDVHNYIYFGLPLLGIALTVFVVRYIVRSEVRHGIPTVLFGISMEKGKLKNHNMYSSILTSTITVGLGGSVGLEGPTVATGAAWGSWLSKVFRLNYRDTILLLGSASAGAMAAIFKAPITGIVFAVEVIMIDFTAFSLIPLLMASSTAVVTSYIFLGQDVLTPFKVVHAFVMSDIPYYVVLGIIAGFVSVYYIKTYLFIEKIFDGFKNKMTKLLVGGAGLGILIFLFPSLYGEGYDAINAGLKGNLDYLFNNSLFFNLHNDLWVALILIAFVIVFKIIAMSLTFAGGGVGGMFAPTLFTGVNTGILFAHLVNLLGFRPADSNNFALIGMAGLIAGVLHAPLTGMFLIADISGGYGLFVPLMITATFAYLIVRAFTPYSVYHIQLARRKQLLTHDKDTNVLRMLEVRKLIENDFEVLPPEGKLGDLVKVIEGSHRDLFPIVDTDGIMKGMLKMDDVRHLIFKHELYDKVFLKDLMYMPEDFIDPDDSMETVAKKFETTGRYNIAVLKDGRYLGFISRARVFSKYRKQIIDVSHV